MAAAKKLKSPLILGTSRGESEFLGLEEITALVEILKKRYHLPFVFLNLDHAKDLGQIKKAIDLGYQAVHFDGSGLPLEKNIKYTKEVVGYARKRGVVVEGELGYLRGKSAFHTKTAKIKKDDLTLPEDAVKFIQATKVDSLAVVIGNIHGVYSRMPKLDFKRLEEINSQNNVFLVLHGGSGISKAELKKAIKFGIVKININTELRLAWRKSLGQRLKRKPGEIKPYKILPFVQGAVQKKVEEKIQIFKSKNKSSALSKR